MAAPEEALTDDQVGFFLEQGYLKLGKVIPDSVLDSLGERITALMMREAHDVPYEKMMFSVCPSQTGSWDDPASRQTYGHKGPTLNYRKICDLERDQVFRSFAQQPLFRDITRRLIGERVGLVRTMYFAKPAETSGVRIDWHQVCRLCLILAINHRAHARLAEPQDKPPDPAPRAVTIWTALDDTTPENGALQIAPRSHKHGPLNFGSTMSFEPTLTPEQEAELTADKKMLTMKRGEVVLLDNLMLHRSDPNTTGKVRRGLSMCVRHLASLASTTTERSH